MTIMSSRLWLRHSVVTMALRQPQCLKGQVPEEWPLQSAPGGALAIRPSHGAPAGNRLVPAVLALHAGTHVPAWLPAGAPWEGRIASAPPGAHWEFLHITSCLQLP
jgi:hypothetical protein